MTTPLAPDWYRDPFGRHEHRYWDGTRWTDHVASAGSQAVDPPVVAMPSAQIAERGEFPADWYPDPTGHAALRYWNGSQWTENVSSGGQQGIDLLPAVAAESATRQPNKRVERQARKVVPDGGSAGGGTLFTEQVLVVNQQVRMLGGTMCYAVFDQRGYQLGMVEEVPRGFKAKTSDSFYRRTDDAREYRFRIVDMNRRTYLTVTRPAKWSSGKSKMVVHDPAGLTIGHITQETHGVIGGMATVAHAALNNFSGIAGAGIGLIAGASAGKAAANVAGKSVGWVAGKAAGFASKGTARAILRGTGADNHVRSAADGLDRVGHVRFALEAGGVRLGTIHAETMDEWGFRMQDPTGAEIGRITKTWAGWTQERFTKADNYVVQMGQPMEGPLRSLAVAAALAIDIALKQGDPAADAARGRRRR